MTPSEIEPSTFRLVLLLLLVVVVIAGAANIFQGFMSSKSMIQYDIQTQFYTHTHTHIYI